MKRILIAGKNSFIGESVENWLCNINEDYIVDTIDLEGDDWKCLDFGSFDSIVHVAGIAHIDYSSKNKDLYFSVNRDLAVETAAKAKTDGAGQFIFMSSIIVYGSCKDTDGFISKDTKPKPLNAYGQSKLEAEYVLNDISSEDFRVAIIRSPMVYGKNAKGNFGKLLDFAQKTPVFPLVYNSRSMIYIDNLCEFIRLIIDNRESGTFYPQNKEYVNTSNLVKTVAEIINKKVVMTRFFNPFIKMFSKNPIIERAFGNLAYDITMSKYDKGNYLVVDFIDSIEKILDTQKEDK